MDWRDIPVFIVNRNRHAAMVQLIDWLRAGARALIGEVFEPVTRRWRGLGALPGGGLGLRPAYAAFDAARRFALADAPQPDHADCHAGEVLQGRLRPDACPAFGRQCTPQRPLGAPMVSSEGACAAYYRYHGAAA